MYVFGVDDLVLDWRRTCNCSFSKPAQSLTIFKLVLISTDKCSPQPSTTLLNCILVI